jgi:DNA-binding beta-propeller fold protein YncE
MKNWIASLIAVGCFAQSSTFNATPTLIDPELADFRDTTPDPDGNTFYFTAIGPSGAGVYRVPASGGVATTVFAGPPFVDPIGIAISGDGRTLYVADPLAYAGSRRTGVVFALPALGGRPVAVRGSEGRGPRGVDVDPSRDSLVFTARGRVDFGAEGKGTIFGRALDPQGAAVYRLPAEGADAPGVVYQGPAIAQPDSLVVARDGAVYVTDRGGRSQFGRVVRIAGGEVSTVVELFRPGTPAGVALTLDESTLLVSSLQPYRDRAQVLVVRLDTLETHAETRVVGANEQAGGLHRARNTGVFGWAGRTNNVYRVVP